VQFNLLGRSAAVPAVSGWTPTAGTAAFLSLTKALNCTLGVRNLDVSSVSGISNAPEMRYVFGNAMKFLLALLLALPVFADTNTAHEAVIARVTASLLAQSHFAAQRDATAVSAKFFDNYLLLLDGAKMFLLESDVAEFSPYRTMLMALTLKTGDTSPARVIFNRFLQRHEQRTKFVHELLDKETFAFTGDETYKFDREHAARPRDLAEAQQLWRQHLRHEYLSEKLGGQKPAGIVKLLHKRYDRTWRTIQKLHADQVFEMYLTALARVFDPHSDYMGPRQLEDFNISMKLSLCGIGAVLQSEDGYCKIREVLPGGPAALSKKIKVGDRIVAVAQEKGEPVDIIEMPLTDAVRLIRGDKGTKVTLTLIPVDAADASVRQSLTLVRDEIRVEQQQARARIVDLPGKDAKPVRLGVVDLPSFYMGADNGKGKREGATADVAKLIEKLKQESIQGLLLDLRRNGGGSLDEAISLTGLFIERGPVVQTKDANGGINVVEDTDPSVLYDGPLVVLTSRFSASASEILAAAVQDYGRGLVVGDPATFGKGTVQNLIQLGPIMQQNRLDGGVNPGALKLTIRKFYRPAGGSTQRKGVVPDLVLPSGSTVLKVGEAQMTTSLPWDAIPATEHDRLNRVGPKLPALRERSSARIANEQEFAWLQEDSERLRAQLAEGAVSLNEKKRLQEKTEQEKRDDARKKFRANHPSAKETQYEITLKLTDLEGLPKPITPGTNDVAAAPDVTLLEAERVLADFVGLESR